MGLSLRTSEARSIFGQTKCNRENIYRPKKGLGEPASYSANIKWVIPTVSLSCPQAPPDLEPSSAPPSLGLWPHTFPLPLHPLRTPNSLLIAYWHTNKKSKKIYLNYYNSWMVISVCTDMFYAMRLTKLDRICLCFEKKKYFSSNLCVKMC